MAWRKVSKLERRLVSSYALTHVLKIVWRKFFKIRAWLGTTSGTCWCAGRRGALGLFGLQFPSVRAIPAFTFLTFTFLTFTFSWLLGSEYTGTGLGRAKKELVSGHYKSRWLPQTANKIPRKRSNISPLHTLLLPSASKASRRIQKGSRKARGAH
jgi:hypothetical protein